jgi:SRSO17 transposase
LPADPLGTVGVVDETSCRKWGDHTPGVQRQYLGCVGKIDSGIVTVHLGVAKGTFQALLDADLYLPKSWAEDRPRCRAAGIPDDVRHRAKWRLAVDQWVRLAGNGVSFDWLVFDEGYGSKVPFLRFLNLVGQRFVADAALSRVLAVAFRRWVVEHAFRLGKQETGLMHYEGRDYTGLLRHLMLAVVVLGFVATHTERLRGEKPTGDGRAGVPGAEPAVRGRVPPAAGRARGPAQQRGHPVPPAAERPGRKVPQETAA